MPTFVYHVTLQVVLVLLSSHVYIIYLCGGRAGGEANACMKLLGLMGRIVKGCVRPGTGKLMYVYVAPPTPVGAWSIALGLRQRFEYYYC